MQAACMSARHVEEIISYHPFCHWDKCTVSVNDSWYTYFLQGCPNIHDFFWSFIAIVSSFVCPERLISGFNDFSTREMVLKTNTSISALPWWCAGDSWAVPSVFPTRQWPLSSSCLAGCFAHILWEKVCSYHTQATSQAQHVSGSHYAREPVFGTMRQLFS